ncbi:hypothetical protein JGI23_01333, partial [Candidatus Chrysopegis kryptomonas]
VGIIFVSVKEKLLDKILLAKYGGGKNLKYGKEYRIISRSDILAVIED